MAKVLATHVHVYKENGESVILEAGSELPAEYEDQVTNPAAFAVVESDEESGDGDGEEGDGGYDGKSNDELKALLKERELPVSGKHDDLVARLQESDEESGDGDGEEGDKVEE